MLIAQMSDIHIGARPAAAAARNLARFRATLDRLLEGPNPPDLLVLSGDLTDRGDAASFAELAALLARCPFPVWPMVGNHDTREALLGAFPHVRPDGEFAHYLVEHEGLRLILLDTTEPGRSGGAFCARRQAWLEARLDEAPDTPTLLFVHHPPAASGIDWMDPAPDAGWVRRLGAAIEGRDNVRGIHCGHLHRPLSTMFRGVPLHVAPSVAPPVALDLRPTDAERPDGRDLITSEPPYYALHRWDGTALATHHEPVGDWHAIVRYDESQQAMIREMLAERTG